MDHFQKQEQRDLEKLEQALHFMMQMNHDKREQLENIEKEIKAKSDRNIVDITNEIIKKMIREFEEKSQKHIETIKQLNEFSQEQQKHYMQQQNKDQMPKKN